MAGKNEIIDLDITAVSTDGSGIGKTAEGLAVFVPAATLGDRLSVKIIKLTKSYAVGKILEVIAPGEGRVAPECTDCTRCGGCNFWHIDYETELRYKQRYVEDNVRRIGGSSAKTEETAPSPWVKRYRNKVIYPVREGTNGQPVFGFFAARSHRVIEVRDCLIEPEIFSRIASWIIAYMRRNNISAYNEETGKGLVRNIFLRTNTKGDVMLCLVVNGKFPGKNLFSQKAAETFDEIKTVVLNYNTAKTNVVLSDRYETVLGKGYLEDELCSLRFRISPASFYQINREQAARLYEAAARLADPRKDDVLLDLYCGTGTIGLSMHNKVKRVIGIEIVPEAVENARENAKINGIENAEFICGDAGKGAALLRERGVKPDIIIVDPPRKGCDGETLSVIKDLSPRKIVYISCNSATLARDIAVLEDFGYSAGTVYPFDMFPRTAHVESVVLLSRE